MKKIISSVLIFALIFSFAVSVPFAADTEASQPAVTFFCTNPSAKAGENFDLDLFIKDNPGICSYTFNFEYDPTYIKANTNESGECVSMEGSVFNSQYYISNGSHAENTITVSSINSFNNTSDGKIFSVHFTAKSDISSEAETKIKITANVAAHLEETTYDIYDIFDNVMPSFEAVAAINKNPSSPESSFSTPYLTEEEFLSTYEERLAALQTPKPTPRPIYPTAKPTPSPENPDIGTGIEDGEEILTPSDNPPTLKNPELTLNSDASKTAYMAPAGENNFKPDTYATRYEVVEALGKLFTVSNTEDKDEFSDVSSEYKKLVNDFAQVGVISGYDNKTFGGEKNITRAEFVKLLTTAFKIESARNVTSVDEITDINSHWAKDYITTFMSNGYILGYPDKTFKPDNNITRAEVVVILNRILNIPQNSSAEAVFEDLTSEHWAFGYIMGMVKH